MKPQESELLQDLKRENERVSREMELVREAEELLQRGVKDDERILERIRNARSSEGPVIDPVLLEEERVFSEAAIRNLCIKYRLRFLSTRHFKDPLPYEAISGLKSLEKRTGKRIEDLRIIAPSERFQLQDSQKDPLLFAHIGKGNFYLLHRWGRDLSPWRKVLNFPFRDIRTLVISCVLLSLLIGFLLPSELFQEDEAIPTNLHLLLRAFSSFLLTSFFLTATLIYGVTTSREFSTDQWNSKFFN